METYTPRDFNTLLNVTGPRCVSIYLPTHRSGKQGVLQDPIRLKNLLRTAETNLIEQNMRPADARDYLAPATALITDGKFWVDAHDGLALFLNGEEMKTYRLPCSVEDCARVGQRFYLRPLLTLPRDAGRFFLLTLSRNRVHFYEGTRRTLEEVHPAGLPTSMDEALDYVKPETIRQAHSGGGGSIGKQSVKKSGIFHGQGGAQDATKKDLNQFMLVLERALKPTLNGQNYPLVVACVDSLFPIFRDVSSYQYVMEECLPGNPDLKSLDDLHEESVDLLDKQYHRAEEVALKNYERLAGSDRSAMEIKDVLRLANEGGVETLLIEQGANLWGTFSPETGVLVLHNEPRPGFEDLIELAAVYTLKNRGDVYVIERAKMPTTSATAAVLRYPASALAHR